MDGHDIGHSISHICLTVGLIIISIFFATEKTVDKLNQRIDKLQIKIQQLEAQLK